MKKVQFVIWEETECPRCNKKVFKRILGAEPYLNNPNMALYYCECCGYEEYRDVQSFND